MKHLNVIEWFEIETTPPPREGILLWWRHNPAPGEISDMIFSGFVADDDDGRHRPGEIVLVHHDPNLDYRSQLTHWAYMPAGPQR